MVLSGHSDHVGAYKLIACQWSVSVSRDRQLPTRNRQLTDKIKVPQNMGLFERKNGRLSKLY